MSVQEKILRVIEYGQFERLGSSKTIEVNVRLIGATNEDLPEMARRGRFRHDLLDRLAFDVITLPPLRERRTDILPLAEHFAMRMTRELGREVFAGFTSQARELLLSYQWPGNIRQLKNVIERAVYRQDEPEQPVGQIQFDPFESPWRPRNPDQEGTGFQALLGDNGLPEDLRGFLDTAERELVLNALELHQYQLRPSAERLGLSYDQLRGLMRKHDISGPRANRSR
jgi:psp operon transcriptional activator